jgi:hypothetical protein
MENMIPMLSGGLRKRPGTWFDGNTFNNNEARLIEWLLSDGNCVILELTAETIRVWQDQGDNAYQVTQTILSPYTVEQIREVHYAASNNEMWVVHKEYPPIKLVLNKDENVIKKYEPTFRRADGKNEEIDFKSENNCPSCIAFESGRLCFAGTNNKPNKIYLSRAPDSKTGENRYTDFTTEDRYITTKEISKIDLNEDGSEKTEIVKDKDGNIMYNPDVLAFKVYDQYNTHLIDINGDIYCLSLNTNAITHESYLILKRVAFIKNQLVIVDEVYGRASYSFYHSKLTIGNVTGGAEELEGIYFLREGEDLTTVYTLMGTWYKKGDPCTQPAYIKYTEDIENINITASHAIILEENDMHGSRLQWLAGSRHLLAATDRATWSDTGEIPTPATFDMSIIDYTGSSNLQARGLKEFVVYAGRDGKSLRALVWNQNQQGGGYYEMNISEQAAHLFTAGIKDFAVINYPYPMIWIVTRAGELISCTVNIQSGILAYAKHPTDGIVEAVTVASQKTGDVIFLSVKRGEVRNIEHIILEDLVNSDFYDSHYVDAGECRTFSTPTKIIEGLQRFAGKKIYVFADGAIEPPVTVSEDGIAELQNEVLKVHFGLPYKAVFSPNTRQIPANGTSVGKKRRIEKIMLQLYKSIGGRAGTDEGKTTEIITKRFGEYKLGTAPEPFTGEYEITVSGNIDTEGKLVVTHEEACPFTMLALVERVAILEV